MLTLLVSHSRVCCRLNVLNRYQMWRSLFLKGTTCLLQVAAQNSPRLLRQRHFSSKLLRLLIKRHPQRFALTASHPPIGQWGTDYWPLSATRTYKKDTKSIIDFPVNPITVTEIKQYLRSKDISFHDGYSCLHAPSIFLDSAPGAPAGSGKEHYTMFIDKTTGQFLCTDTLVEGSWEDLQDCLEVMQKEQQAFLSPHVLLGYPESLEEQEEREREQREVQRVWSSSVPLSDLAEEETQLIKTMFQVGLRRHLFHIIVYRRLSVGLYCIVRKLWCTVLLSRSTMITSTY